MSYLKNNRKNTKLMSTIGATLLFVTTLIFSLGAAPVGASNSSLQPRIAPPVPCCGGGGNLYWGVDSTDPFTTGNPTLLSQVESQLGTPGIIGRYLNDGGTVLTKTEASTLIGDGIPLVLYYSPTNTALIGTATADTESAQAIAEAKSIGATAHTSVAIYRDMEPPGYGYTINSSYVTRWYQDIANAGFIAGFYEDSYAGPFESAFCGASSNAIANTYLQTPQLQYPPSYSESEAPTNFNPYYVACESASQMMGWQYLIGDSSPHVDVDEYSLTGAFQ